VDSRPLDAPKSPSPLPSPGVPGEGGRGNILIATLGSHGDVHPFLGLGRTLKARGHRVTIIAAAVYDHLAQGLGLEFAPLGTKEEFQEMLRNPDLWHKTRGFHAIADAVSRVLRPTYDAIVERNVPGQTVIVQSSLAFGARIAQDKWNIPAATVHLSPAVIRSITSPPKLPGLFMPGWMPLGVRRAMFAVIDRWIVDRAMAPPVNALRAELGLPAVDKIMANWWNSPNRVIGLFPSWFGHAKDWPPQAITTDFPLYDEQDVTPVPEVVEKFLAAGDPPLLFTPGSAMMHGEEFFAAAVDACRRLCRRGILLSRHREHIPANLPADVIHVDFVPFSRILPRSAALVHHGGIGTSAQAMRAGVPQLVMPMSHDQFDNVDRMMRLGVAAALPRRRFTGKAVAARLAALLDSPATAAACLEVASRFHPGVDPLAETADCVERLLNAPAASMPTPQSAVG
jgi:UDP:flavonoid glycosyltransferase YjiC (YdhE family)